RIALCRNELDLGAACSLRQPDMAHRWKLELTHHDFLPFAKIQGTGDAVDACRCTGYNSNFIGTGIDKFRKGCACRFVAIYPQLPGRALLMPTGNVVLEPGLYRIRQRALRTAIEIDLAPEDRKAGTA